MGVENNIPEGWIEVNIAEIATTNDELISRDYNHLNIEYLDTGSITKNSIEGFQLFDLKEAPSRAKRLVKNGDIIYSTVRPNQEHYGYINNPKANCVVSTGFCVIRTKDTCYSKFLYHFLTQNKVRDYLHLLGEQSASAYPSIKPIDIENLIINIPGEINEQKAIAKVLTAFDDKIELLQAQNKTLENMAQTIFKEWFGKYQISDELPEGWRVRELRDLAEKISKGTTPRKNDVQGKENTIFFLKVKDISDDGLISNKNLALIPKEVHRNQLKRSILESNDILFSIAGTIGRVAILNEDLNDCNCNQAIAFIRLKNKNEFLEYVHLWIKSKEIQTEINSSIVQGVQANVSLTVLGDLKIILPSDSTMLRWKGIIKPIYDKIYNNNNQIKSLTKTRDNLLPKLMSGQVRVNNIKQTADA